MKIEHAFTIPLTRDQAKKLRAKWNKHGQEGGAIIMQPRLNWGPFHIRRPNYACAIVSPALAKAINAQLAKAPPA